MKGRRRRGCGRWRLRLALAQHVAQPGRPSMPVHFVVAGSRAPSSWTLGALIIEKYGRFSFMQTPSRTIEQIATHFIRTLQGIMGSGLALTHLA